MRLNLLLRTTYLTIFFVLPYVATAQWYTNTLLYTSVCSELEDQYNAVLVPDEQGGTYLVWMDKRVFTWPPKIEVYMQRINEYGYQVLPKAGVKIADSLEYNFWFTAIPDTKNGLILAHDGHSGNASRPKRICLHRIDSTGAESWVRQWVFNNRHYQDSRFAIISDGHGGAFVSQFYPRWDYNDIEFYDGGDLYGQWIDSTGSNRWHQDGLRIAVLDSAQVRPSMVPAQDNGFYIAWEDDRHIEIDSLYDLRIQRVDTSGTLLWGPEGVLLTQTRIQSHNITLTPQEKGGVMVCWVDGKRLHRETPQLTDDSMLVVAQYVSDTGTFLWDSSGVEVSAGLPRTSLPGDEIKILQTVKGKEGKTIVTWYMQDGRIFAQSLDSAGGAVFPGNTPVLLLDIPAGTASTYDVTADGTGGALVTYLQGTQPSQTGLHTLHLNADGSIGWKDRIVKKGLRRPTIVSHFERPHLLSDGGIGYYISWTDDAVHTQSLDIYIDRINALGYSFPVELVSFTAEDRFDEVHLQWTTLRETNNSHFTVQRSVDDGWIDRGTVRGRGVSDQSSAYSFADNTRELPSSVRSISYRLLQTDFDGSIQYSPVVTVKRSPFTPSTPDITIYPQPVDNNMSIALSLHSESDVLVTVADMLGRIRKTRTYRGSNIGYHLLNLDMSNIPAGMYQVRIQLGSDVVCKNILRR